MLLQASYCHTVFKLVIGAGYFHYSHIPRDHFALRDGCSLRVQRCLQQGGNPSSPQPLTACGREKGTSSLLEEESKARIWDKDDMDDRLVFTG